MILPDKGTGDNDIQSIMFYEYWKAYQEGIRGLNCVVSGGAVTSNANMAPSVAACVVVTNGILKAVAGTTVTITTADATNPRIDLIVVTSAGAFAVRAGTPAAAPKPPTRTANDVLLASVFVAANDTTMAQTCIDDKATFGDAPTYEMKLTGTYGLTSTTSEQKLFDGSANGRLTLIAGVYEYECTASISGLSSTSGNGAFDILGAGSATLTDVLYPSIGADGNANTAATQTGSMNTAAQSPASQQTAGAGTTWNFSNRGTFEVTAGGTIVPSVTLVTAAAGVVAAGSNFKCRYRGAAGANTVIGPWD